MQFDAFLLDQWIERKFSSGWHIAHDLSASSGPSWSVGELLDLAGPDAIEQLRAVPVTYPSAAGSLELRSAIADFEAVSPDDVQILTGAQEALLAIFFTAATPGANVILPHPGFPPFTTLPKGLGLEVRHYHLRPENRFELDVDEVKRLADRQTALVLINSPHNPSGVVISEATRRLLHDFCAERDIQLVCDQVFHPNYYGPAVSTAATLPHATVVGDFSKALCLAGLRVGWIVDRNHSRLERYRDARMYFTISNGSVAEWLAVIAMRHRDAVYARAREVSVANLQELESAWSTDKDTMAWVKPQGGFTVFPWIENEADTRPLCERLGERGIMVVPGDCFGMPSHIRIGFGGQRERFAEDLARLNAELRTYFVERGLRSNLVVS